MCPIAFRPTRNTALIGFDEMKPLHNDLITAATVPQCHSFSHVEGIAVLHSWVTNGEGVRTVGNLYSWLFIAHRGSTRSRLRGRMLKSK